MLDAVRVVAGAGGAAVPRPERSQVARIRSVGGASGFARHHHRDAGGDRARRSSPARDRQGDRAVRARCDRAVFANRPGVIEQRPEPPTLIDRSDHSSSRRSSRRRCLRELHERRRQRRHHPECEWRRRRRVRSTRMACSAESEAITRARKLSRFAARSIIGVTPEARSSGKSSRRRRPARQTTARRRFLFRPSGTGSRARGRRAGGSPRRREEARGQSARR